MTNLYDTITAISTPLGTGGVGIIRLSGSDCTRIIGEIFSKKPEEKTPITLHPMRVHHGWIIENEHPVDEVIVLYFKSPNSYTGEDIAEIHCHGGLNVVRKILNLTIAKGARLAERGEFTKRAFLNQKLDLSQAEAVLDLIHSKTDIFSGLSANNLSGRLSQYIAEIKQETFDLLSKITAAIDFPEDVTEPPYEFIETELEKIIAKLNRAIATFSNSNMMRQGIKVTIAGKPNAGKSSLFNSLLDIKRAIVTNIAGTTRDAIDIPFKYNGKKYMLIDTAGMRRKKKIEDETVERYSIIRSLDAIRNADIVVLVIDSSTEISDQDLKIAGFIDEQNKPSVIVLNKWDLIDKDTNTMNKFEKTLKNELSFMSYFKSVYLSALTGKRTEKLMQAVEEVLENNNRQISAGSLNDVLQDAYTVNAPAFKNNKRLKIFYATQSGTNPPTFVLFVNDINLMTDNYLRYLENNLRKAFDFTGTPIRIKLKCKKDYDL